MSKFYIIFFALFSISVAQAELEATDDLFNTLTNPKKLTAQDQCDLGVMYLEDGKERKARRLFKKAAKKGNAEAQYQLALMYEKNGNYKKALKLYKELIEQGYKEAQYRLALLYEKSGNYQKALDLYMKLAEQGHAKAQYQLGLIYEQGLGVEQDDEQAFAWYKKSIRNAQDQLDLASKYSDKGNHQRAFDLYKELADKGNAKAQFKVALMYEKGLGVEQDDEQAFAWYRESIRTARDQLSLASKYSDKGNHQRAFDLYKELADKGNSEAQSKLAFMYKKGLGVEQDDEQAFNWYRRSTRGIKDQFDLASKYYHREKDYPRALELYKELAERGHAKAQYQLGLMYEQGLGVEPDEEQAYTFYKESIRSVKDQLDLANKYNDQKDYKRSIELYRELADKGNKTAQYRLRLSEVSERLDEAENSLIESELRLNESNRLLDVANRRLSEVDTTESNIQNVQFYINADKRLSAITRSMVNKDKDSIARIRLSINEAIIKENKSLSEVDELLNRADKIAQEANERSHDVDNRFRDADENFRRIDNLVNKPRFF